MRKQPKINVISYVTKNGQQVRFDELTPSEKQYAATVLKLAYLNELYRGIAHFTVDEEALRRVREGEYIEVSQQ